MRSGPQSLRIEDLRLDLNNPRMPASQPENETDAILELARTADLGELVQSIANSGWIDFEPLIALQEDGAYTVLEGNRRLAALKVMGNPKLQNVTGVKVPDSFSTDDMPDTVLVNVVTDRAAARDFIGFKHVNGAFKWDALAKAHFAWTWLNDDPSASIETISERLGDQHRTVVRLVNGFVVLKQAECLGFDRSQIDKRVFYFSHLYTAVSVQSVREYLGLPIESSRLLGNNPVTNDKHHRLTNLMTWLYGQGPNAALIRSQNPDLTRLTRVLANKAATTRLEQTRNLEEAFDEVEDKGARFAENLFNLDSLSRRVLSQVSDYNGDTALIVTARSIEKTTRSISTILAGTDS